jgi:hypothetical protein
MWAGIDGLPIPGLLTYQRVGAVPVSAQARDGSHRHGLPVRKRDVPVWVNNGPAALEIPLPFYPRDRNIADQAGHVGLVPTPDMRADGTH